MIHEAPCLPETERQRAASVCGWLTHLRLSDLSSLTMATADEWNNFAMIRGRKDSATE